MAGREAKKNQKPDVKKSTKEVGKVENINSKQNWKAGNMLYPVPVVMVSCKAEGKKSNIITIAWAGTICSDPPMVSISVRKERFSHDLIEESGEFVINLVNEELTAACDWCGVRSGRDHDKFGEMKLTEYVSDFMKTPAIAESPVNIYCKVTKKEELGSHDMYLAEVVGVTVSEKYMDDKGRFDLSATGLVAYSHGEYFLLGEKLGKFGYSVNRKSNMPEKSITVRKPKTSVNKTKAAVKEKKPVTKAAAEKKSKAAEKSETVKTTKPAVNKTKEALKEKKPVTKAAAEKKSKVAENRRQKTKNQERN